MQAFLMMRGAVSELDSRRYTGGGAGISLGVFLIVLGFIASGIAVWTTMLSVVVLGWILLGAGAGLVLLSFLTGRWSGFLLTLATGILSIITGIEILSNPVFGAVAITMLIGILLIVAGIYRSVASIVMQFPNWGWSVVSGIVTLALGFMLLKNLQSTSLWFLIGADYKNV
jgi:uncharacterized membrane protein HdeD (DUF308 family)